MCKKPPKVIPPSKVPLSEQQEWLYQHIPHRICAALTRLGKMEGKWNTGKWPKIAGFHGWCAGRSFDEGHYAAMRWLIEFIGIARTRGTKESKRPTEYGDDQCASIDRFDNGTIFHEEGETSQFLADVWAGCTQASVHPTRDTRHPDVGDDTLAKALGVVLGHLQAKLYGPKLNLFQIVQLQEKRAALRDNFPDDWIIRFETLLLETAAQYA